MLPLAMIHMAMPVTMRGWLNFLMLPTFFRNAAPTLYFWVILIATSLPGAIVIAVPVFLFWPSLLELSQSQSNESFAMTSQMWIALSVTLVVSLAVQLLNSFVLLFNMRVIGLMAYYFQNSLDLVTFIAEKTYVSKVIKTDRFGVPIKTKGQKAGEIALVIGVFVVVGACGYFVYRQVSK